MDNLPEIYGQVRQDFDARTAARDRALAQCRELTRHAAHAIRAIHRDEVDLANEHLAGARELVNSLQAGLAAYPDLFHAGYTQDAIKEFVEASNTCALIQNKALLTPAELGVESATYMNGLAEVVGELRRRCLDILRHGYSEEAERLLSCMDEIYAVLVTLDYPDAITNGLRRQTDLIRGIIERTRADLTTSLGEQKIHLALRDFQEKLANSAHADDSGL